MRPSSHDVPHAGDLQHDEHRGGAVGPQDISEPGFPHDVGANVWVRKLEMESREVCSWQKNQHSSCPPSPTPADKTQHASGQRPCPSRDECGFLIHYLGDGNLRERDDTAENRTKEYRSRRSHAQLTHGRSAAGTPTLQPVNATRVAMRRPRQLQRHARWLVDGAMIVLGGQLPSPHSP